MNVSRLKAILHLEVAVPTDEDEANRRADAIWKAIDEAVADLPSRSELGILRCTLDEFDWRGD